MFITLGSSRFLNILYGWKRVLFSYTTERVCYQVVKYRRGDLGSAELLSSSMDNPKPDTFLQPILQCCAERGEKRVEEQHNMDIHKKRRFCILEDIQSMFKY